MGFRKMAEMAEMALRRRKPLSEADIREIVALEVEAQLDKLIAVVEEEVGALGESLAGKVKQVGDRSGELLEVHSRVLSLYGTVLQDYLRAAKGRWAAAELRREMLMISSGLVVAMEAEAWLRRGEGRSNGSGDGGAE